MKCFSAQHIFSGMYSLHRYNVPHYTPILPHYSFHPASNEDEK